MQGILPKIRNKARMSALATFIQHCIGTPSHCNKTRKMKSKSYELEKQ